MERLLRRKLVDVCPARKPTPGAVQNDRCNGGIFGCSTERAQEIGAGSEVQGVCWGMVKADYSYVLMDSILHSHIGLGGAVARRLTNTRLAATLPKAISFRPSQQEGVVPERPIIEYNRLSVRDHGTHGISRRTRDWKCSKIGTAHLADMYIETEVHRRFSKTLLARRPSWQYSATRLDNDCDGPAGTRNAGPSVLMLRLRIRRVDTDEELTLTLCHVARSRSGWS